MRARDIHKARGGRIGAKPLLTVIWIIVFHFSAGEAFTVLWTTVEKPVAEKLSAGDAIFPQFIHIGMWTEKRWFYKRLGRFCTYPQALLLVLKI